MVKYRIVFESESNVFSPGTEFNGFIYLNTDGTTKARKIDLKIMGYAKTKWTSRHSDSNGHSHTTTHGCQVDYIYEYAILWKSNDGSNQLPAGEYQFPFTVKIPKKAPASFNGDYGYVRYYVRTNIDIPWAYDETRMTDFIVAAVVDLNIDERLSCQAQRRATKNIRQWCSCKSNPIILKVTLPKTGYIRGETLSITVYIVNKTSLKMKSIEVSLVKYFLFLGNDDNGSSDCKNWEATIIHRVFELPENGGTSVYTFTVPKLEPSYLECSIITIAYYLVIKTHTNAVFSSGPKVEIPIVIGTIPIQEDEHVNEMRTQSVENKL